MDYVMAVYLTRMYDVLAADMTRKDTLERVSNSVRKFEDLANYYPGKRAPGTFTYLLQNKNPRGALLSLSRYDDPWEYFGLHNLLSRGIIPAMEA